MISFVGNVCELHIETGICYGVLFLDEPYMVNRYIPFVTSDKHLIDVIRKGNGHYSMKCGFVNDGGSTYENLKIVFEVTDVKEV